MVKIYDGRVINDLVVLEQPNQTRWTNVCFAPLGDQEVLIEECQDFQLIEDAEIDMEEGRVLKSVDPYRN